ncbi:MAG: hypothetical protein K0Q79_1315 [Flavipsychrobacter sp.]|jgi:hypothetical protein|nr:hypothetical protein [Flavipsychrobacter sp.]
MRKLLLGIFICLSGNYNSYAQVSKTDDVKKSLETSNKDTTAWVYGGFVNIGLNEGFLHNWAAGGELVSMTVNGVFSGHFDRLMHGAAWTNNLDLSYGLNYMYSNDFTPRKTDDRIDFTSKYGRRIDTSNLYITALFNFKSQFSKGFDYTKPNWDSAPTPTSEFLSPAYFTLAVGAEYKKGSNLSLFLSPIAGRLVLVDRYYTSMSPTGAFGVDSGKNMQFQFGAYFSGRYLVDISKRATFKTRLDLYSNYIAKDRKDAAGKVIKKDDPGNIDILFDNFFTWKASKFLNITLGATFIYDNDIPYSKTTVDNTGATVEKKDPGKNLGWVQVKQFFNVGIEYKF